MIGIRISMEKKVVLYSFAWYSLLIANKKHETKYPKPKQNTPFRSWYYPITRYPLMKIGQKNAQHLIKIHIIWHSIPDTQYPLFEDEIEKYPSSDTRYLIPNTQYMVFEKYPFFLVCCQWLVLASWLTTIWHLKTLTHGQNVGIDHCNFTQTTFKCLLKRLGFCITLSFSALLSLPRRENSLVKDGPSW